MSGIEARDDSMIGADEIQRALWLKKQGVLLTERLECFSLLWLQSRAERSFSQKRCDSHT